MKLNNAKMNMIKQQIRTEDVLDNNVLNLIASLPREDFVPTKYRRLAFADMQIPLDHEQVMMSPCVEAKILQALSIRPTDKILEIGTGTGYLTAAFAKSAQHVYSIDIFEDFLISAEQRLQQLHINNVSLQEGNGAQGWDKQKPYDVICLTGSLPFLPLIFKEQLKINGRLFAILGNEKFMEALLITRIKENEWQEKRLFETEIKPLLMTLNPDPFKF